MTLLFIIIGIAILSVVWSVWSLKKLQKTKEVEEAQKRLSKGKILFYDSSASKSS